MINCIIVDDERPARKLIQLHLSKLEGFALAGSFDNAVDAFAFVEANQVDLIFLDIQMPRVTGLQLIKSLKNLPGIILTTAYREHAVEAFELDVVDYLVKPITEERFRKAIGKFRQSRAATIAPQPKADNFSNAYLFLKTGREQTKVFMKEIVYIEGLRDYVKVHCINQVLIVSESLNYMEQKLPDHKFVRIHKSYIAAIESISHYTADEVTIDKIKLPVGRTFKQQLLKTIGSL